MSDLLAQPAAPRYTETEQKILNLLADGRPHTRRELHTCLRDELGNQEEKDAFRNLRQRIYYLRRKLPHGEMIVCVVVENRKICYQHVLHKCPAPPQIYTPGPSTPSVDKSTT